MNGQILSSISAFKDMHVLVIGDAASDIDLKGSSERVAREAPVPIVQIDEVVRAPGRAANAAVNVAQLGGKARFLSVAGDDSEGALLMQMLKDNGVDVSQMFIDPKRQMQTVERVMAGDHLLVRFDRGSGKTLTSELAKRYIQRLQSLFPQADAVLVSDYGYGVVSAKVIEELARLQARFHKPLVIDSKYLDKYRQVQASVVKPNYQEALRLLGLTKAEQPGKRVAQLEAHRERLLDITGANTAAVTLDIDGAVSFTKQGEWYRTYGRQVQNSKAVGAGDTYTAAQALALAAGASFRVAADIAQAAATIVIQKSGTATCHKNELIRFFNTHPKFIADGTELKAYVERLRKDGQRVVFTNGCFDILHSGHVSYLAQAKTQGDVLIVALNSDASVRRLKGHERPINPLGERARVIAGLDSVDVVTSFEEDAPLRLIKTIKPDLFVKGGDYTAASLPEASMVKRLGGQVAIMPFVAGRSTTGLITYIRQRTHTVKGGSQNVGPRSLGQPH